MKDMNAKKTFYILFSSKIPFQNPIKNCIQQHANIVTDKAVNIVTDKAVTSVIE
jgi:hypothetical protein